jgi:uncharacterized membrane protein
VDDHDRVKSVIRSDVPNQAPLAGEVPFFLGVNHLNAIQAADDVVDVQLLVRTLELD